MGILYTNAAPQENPIIMRLPSFKFVYIKYYPYIYCGRTWLNSHSLSLSSQPPPCHTIFTLVGSVRAYPLELLCILAWHLNTVYHVELGSFICSLGIFCVPQPNLCPPEKTRILFIDPTPKKCRLVVSWACAPFTDNSDDNGDVCYAPIMRI